MRVRVGGWRMTTKGHCVLNGGKEYCPLPQSTQTGNVHPCSQFVFGFIHVWREEKGRLVSILY